MSGTTYSNLAALLLGAALPLSLVGGCGDDAVGSGTTDAVGTTGTTGAATTAGPEMTTTSTTGVGPGGSDSEGDTEATTSATEATTAMTSAGTTEGCPEGTEDCPCAPGDLCDDPLVCEDGVCVQPSDAVCGDGVVEGDEECDDGGDNGDNAACKSDCTLNFCGDGLQGPDEECDDGNDDDTDECPSTCAAASCGDGFVQMDVEECDDGNHVDTDACTSGCADASCGDGYVYEGVEDCDDGGESEVCDDDCTPSECGDQVVNMSAGEDCDDGGESDACDADCTQVECGDGELNMAAGEECDDGNTDGGDGCSANCTSEAKRAFVSSEMYTGAMGGLAGADANCQSLADSAGLGGTYLAWLGTPGNGPAQRFTQSNMPYIRVDGVQIAPNWAGLTDGNLDAPLNVTETGGQVPIGNTSCAGGGFPTVWSGITNNGSSNSSFCGGWTNTNGGSAWGQADTQGQWTSWCGGGLCSWVSPIYCFEQ